MAGRIVRAAVVGASSLLGKELVEELNGASSLRWDLRLLEVDSAATQLTAAGDEAVVIQPLEAESFAGMSIVFFAGDAETTLKHWRAAVQTGAGVVDLSGALDGETGVAVRSPWVQRASGGTLALDLATTAVVSAHPAAVMLGVALSRLSARFTVTCAAATVLEPASQQGTAGLDEMHAQTVALLSFQTLPKGVFDAQVAFNFNAELGSAARVDLATVRSKIRKHLQLIAGESLSAGCALQLIQAPVFNGYTASVFIETADAALLGEIESTLDGGVISIPATEDGAPSNHSATEQSRLLLQVRAESDLETQGSGFWLWMAADNLRLAARNAAACAAELLTLKPEGKPQ